MPLIYGKLAPDKMEMGFTPLYFGRSRFFYKLTIKITTIEPSE
jgi:hypothetical protein